MDSQFDIFSIFKQTQTAPNSINLVLNALFRFKVTFDYKVLLHIFLRPLKVEGTIISVCEKSETTSTSSNRIREMLLILLMVVMRGTALIEVV